MGVDSLLHPLQSGCIPLDRRYTGRVADVVESSLVDWDWEFFAFLSSGSGVGMSSRESRGGREREGRRGAVKVTSWLKMRGGYWSRMSQRGIGGHRPSS